MAPFSFGSKPDPVKKRQQELEAEKERLKQQFDELQQELQRAAEPEPPEEEEDPGPPVWRAGEEEWETLSDRTSYNSRQQRDRRINDRNQFLILGVVLVIVLALIFYVLWPVSNGAGAN